MLARSISALVLTISIASAATATAANAHLALPASARTALQTSPSPGPSVAPSPPAPSSEPASDSTPAPGASELRRPVSTPLAVPPGAAMLVNTGSTNFAGYAIAVMPNGDAVVNTGGATTSAKIGAPQARWLFLKLAQDQPYESMRTNRCMKSASFGSSTYIVFNGARTPDLSCGGDASINELGRTVNVIVKQLNITQTPGRRRAIEM